MNQISELSAPWLTETLRTAKVIGPDVTVESFQTRALTGGLMASTLLIDLAYRGGDGSELKTMVGKFPSLDVDSRRAGLEMHAYEREVMFYRYLSDSVGMRVPACYFAEMNQETGDFTLLIEDLSAAIVATPETEQCFELAQRSAAQLALLHKATWNDAEIRSIPWVSDFSDEKYMRRLKSWATQGWEIIKSVPDERLPLASQRAGGRLLEGLEVWSELIHARGCLAHCDYRFGNILYSDTEAITIDWQTLHWSNPGTDIAYFLNNSLSPDQRKDWQSSLRKTYFDALVAEGVSGYTTVDSDFDFRFGLLYSLFMLMTTVFGVGATHLSEEARDGILTAFSRAFESEAEFDALAILK